MSNMNETIAALRARRGAGPAAPVRMRELADFGENPGALRALTYVPPILKRKAPLVVALHGCSQNGEGYAHAAGWLALADRHGFMVLCPEQRASNNPNLCFSWFLPGDTARGAGEAASIAQMIRHVVDAEGLDPERVYITGLSAGGAMTAAMLATYPELFAAGTVIAGLPYKAADSVGSAFAAMAQAPQRSSEEWGRVVREAAPHDGRWPKISIWHGDADATVRPAAGEALVRQWTNVHGVEEAAPSRKESEDRAHSVWTCERGEARVEYHIVRGMGHGTPIRAAGADACGSAAPYMLDFGICSSSESLSFWGVVDAVPRRAAPERPARSEPPPRARRPAPAKGLGVDAVISAALKKAGLLK